MESGLPIFNPGSTSPNLLEGIPSTRLQGFHLLWPGIPTGSLAPLVHPLSLAATHGVAIAFLSCGYLDVSVHQVRLHTPMYSAWDTLAGGFPHSDISGSKPV